jgi:hypothetical protein
MRHVLVACTALLALATGPAPAAAQSIAGEWDATMETPGGARTSKLILLVDGQKVTGTIKRETGDAAVTGTIVGDTLRFSYTIVYNENSLLMSVFALRSGEAFQGSVSFGGQGEMEWSAVRAPGAVRRPDPALRIR